MKNLASKIESSFPRDVVRLLKLAGRFGDDRGYAVYAVGGFVRDLLFGIENLDIDLTVEGDGIAYATYFGRKLSGKVVEHQRFGTATVFLKSGHRVDVTTAREEWYRHPAALPDVKSSAIRADLLRRDFTINALAVRLNPRHFGELVDLFNGENDLRRGTIRVLHNLSFEDDPTRLFRAVKFRHRFGFRIEPMTRILMKKAVERKICDRLSGRRLRNEIYLLLNEKDRPGAVKQMARLGVLQCVHNRLRFDSEKLGLLRRIDRATAVVQSDLDRKIEEWLVYFLCLVYGLKKTELEQVSKRLMLSRKEHQAVVALAKAGRICNKLVAFKKHTPSIIYRTLRDVPAEVLIMVIAIANTREVKKLVESYISEWRKIRIALTGKDLLRLGFKPGPHFRKILEKVLYARIDGCLRTRQDEIAYVTKNFGKK